MVTRRALSLVEILITVSIMGLVLAIGVPNFTRMRLKQRESELRQNLQSVREAVDRMAADTGAYPLALSDLTSATAPSIGYVAGRRVNQFWWQVGIAPSDWRGPYLQKIPLDPITDVPLGYGPTGPVGSGHPVQSTLTTISSEGTRYSTW